MPPSIASEGRDPLEPQDGAFPDAIPVGELGSGPADRWVDPAPAAAPYEPFAAPAPPPPPAPDAMDGWALDEADTSLDDLLTTPDVDTMPAHPPAPAVPALPVAAPAVPAAAPAAPPAEPGAPLALGPGRTKLSSAVRDLEDLLAFDTPTLDADHPSPEPETSGAGRPPADPPSSAKSTGGGDDDPGDDSLGGLDDLFDDDDVPPAPSPAEGGWIDIDAVSASPTAAAPSAAAAKSAAAKVRTAPGTYDPPVQRRLDYDRAGNLVDRVTGYIGNRPELASRISGFQLTRDDALDAQQRAELTHIVTRELSDAQLPVTAAELPELLDVVYDELIGLGPMGDPWRDPKVTEILVDAWDKIYVEVGGKLLTTTYRFRDPSHVERTARDLAQRVSGRALSQSSALVTAELPAARINFAYKPVVRSGIAITLRKLDGVMGMAELLRFGALTDEMAEFLHEVVAARSAVLVSGGTGVGKTTLLNALSEAIADDERVVTIEDSYELRLANRFVVSMQTKEAASADDTLFIGQSDLLRNSLRMRPDRIIVGETRDPDAASVMLAAANTGHEGTMTTIHANTADSALNVRLTNLVRSGDDVSTDIARWEIAEAFDLVVQGTRSRYDGRRFVSEIAEVTTEGLDEGGRIKLNPIFVATARPDEPVVFEQVGKIRPNGRLAERLAASGVDISRWS